MGIYGINFSLRDGDVKRTYVIRAANAKDAIAEAFVKLSRDRRLTPADFLVFDISVALLSC